MLKSRIGVKLLKKKALNSGVIDISATKICIDGKKCDKVKVGDIVICRHGVCLKNGKEVCPAELIEEHVRAVWKKMKWMKY